jgi:hypothetical protein
VVVLPLVPVMHTHAAVGRPARSRMRQASSTSPQIRDPVDYDVLAVELSSFQLHWAHSLSPLAAVCLNVAEDQRRPGCPR